MNLTQKLKQIAVPYFDSFFELRRYAIHQLFSGISKKQENNTKLIPVIIINFNQLFYLKQLVDTLISKGSSNIVILDNNSTYAPLLDYYKIIKDKITIEMLPVNEGHLVFWKNKEIFKKYGKGYYVLTDADIVPNSNLPINYLNQMINVLIQI